MRVLSLRDTNIVGLTESLVRNFLAHRMTTFAAALAYRALFGIFPFILLVIALLAVLRVDGVFEWLIEQAEPAPPQEAPEPLSPMVEQGREQAEPLERLIEQAKREASGGLLWLGVAVGLWSVSAVARTLIEAMNTAYEVAESRRGWKRFTLSVAFGPFLALVVIAATGLMLIGPRVIERLTDLIGLDEMFITLWAWLRLPVALFLLAVVLSLVYRFAPNVDQEYRMVVPGAALAVAAWAITSLGFSVYLANFANYSVTYGALGAAIALLFYLYLSASVVLFGAELNAAILRGLGQTKEEQE